MNKEQKNAAAILLCAGKGTRMGNNERNKVDKVRKFEYDSNGVCTRRLNYNANGTLNSYRQFEYTFE
jgi:CTP:molybdopterin cytidylyltransferase MocA